MTSISASSSSSSGSSSTSSGLLQIDVEALREENSHPNGEYVIVSTAATCQHLASQAVAVFRQILGSDHVLELGQEDGDWERLTQFLHPSKAHNARIIVVGGDGTVGWVVSAIEGHRWHGVADRPFVSVLPVGMRNDFARAVGWAKRPVSNASAMERVYRSYVGDGEIGLVDLWRVDITYYVGHQKLALSKMMTSSFSLGCDAEICSSFQRLMKAHPRLCNGCLQRAFWYGAIAISRIPYKALNLFLKVVIDGKEVPIPQGTKSLVVANINSFAAGVKLWKPRKKEEALKASELYDSKLEVVAFTGNLPLAFTTLNTMSPKPVGQGSVIDIYCGVEPDAVQVDGEALDFISPIQVVIRHHGAFKALLNVKALERSVPPETKDPGALLGLPASHL